MFSRWAGLPENEWTSVHVESFALALMHYYAVASKHSTAAPVTAGLSQHIKLDLLPPLPKPLTENVMTHFDKMYVHELARGWFAEPCKRRLAVYLLFDIGPQVLQQLAQLFSHAPYLYVGRFGEDRVGLGRELIQASEDGEQVGFARRHATGNDKLPCHSHFSDVRVNRQNHGTGRVTAHTCSVWARMRRRLSPAAANLVQFNHRISTWRST